MVQKKLGLQILYLLKMILRHTLLIFFAFLVVDAVASPTPDVKPYTNYSHHYTTVGGNSGYRYFILQGGVSLYSANKEKSFAPLSGFLFHFSQNIKEVKNIGDLDLQISLLAAPLKEKKALFLEVTPRIRIPERKIKFPVFVGLGGGLGIYPYHVIKGKNILATHFELFSGLQFSDLYHNIGVVIELVLRIDYPFEEAQPYIGLFVQSGVVFKL